MSRSSSAGDLVPKDIAEMLALQNKISKSKKKRGSSLSRTFSWFKGSKPKRIVSNGQSRSGRLGGWTGECSIIRQNVDSYDVSKAGQKQDDLSKLTVHYTASQHLQENVFIKGSRPKYLEDLHTEAQEGLKMLQQEEHNIARDLEDNQPVSTGSTQLENDVNCEERDGHLSFDSTTDRLSAVSAVISGPVLTRQGSTFKPLNTAKRLDNYKKRSRRTTIMGIPQQVQRELCMGRRALLQLPLDEDDSSGKVIIPSIDGEGPITNHEGARVHLQDIEALQGSRDDQFLSHHIHVVYRDDFFLSTKSGAQVSQRPKSLAVPGITTFSTLLQEPQGPVMSISPQATYLSTIIPNAILPSAIDVIEIDRSCNQRSVSTVSKSSLAPASPASSHSGGGTHDEPYSTSSKWSHSQSSETIVSHPSTISFKGSMLSSHVTDSMKEVTDLNEEQISLKSSVSCSDFTSKADSQRLQGELSDAAGTAQNSRSFSHHRSVMKTKLPPAPPKRTYSLHHEKLNPKTNELAGTKVLKYRGANTRQLAAALYTKEDPTSLYIESISTQSPASPIYDNSKLSVTAKPHKPVQNAIKAQSESNNSLPQDIFERTLSPSSGYSSQSGTPTHSSKDICPSSPGKQKLKPPKPERTGTQLSPAVSVSSSLVSLSSNVSDPANQLTQTQISQSQPAKIILAVTTIQNKVPPPTTETLRDLFNIPPPPKVKAPCPPPPETWAHNERTTELLCGLNPKAHSIYELQKHYQTDIILMKNQATVNTTNLTSRQRQISVETDTCYASTVGLPQNDFLTTETKETNTEDQCFIKYSSDQNIFENKTTKSLRVEAPKASGNSPSSSSPPEHSSPFPSSGAKMSSVCSVSVQEQQPEVEKEFLTLEPSWPLPPPPMDESSDLILEGQDAIDFPPPPPPDMQESFVVTSEHHKAQSSGHGDRVDPEKSHDLSNLDNHTEKNPEPQLTQNTMLEETSNEPLPVYSIPNVSHDKLFDQTHARPQSFQNVSQDCIELVGTETSVPFEMSLKLKDKSLQSLLQETSLPPQHDPLNSSAILLQRMSHAPALSNDLKNTPSLPSKRQPSQISKDSRCKGLSSMQKCAPIPKEDANIPLVTPSLLQMVRLQTVNVEDQVDILSQKSTAAARTTPDQDLSVSSQVTPQKPIRKSCMKSTQSPVKSSMRLQEAIRMKTAAMSSSGFPAKPSLHLPTTNVNSKDVPVLSSKTPDDCKSPTSTASFIFSKSTKKVVIETATSLEAQASLKQSLAAELMQVSDQQKTMVTNGTKKHHKVPPPVARKPVYTSPSEKVGSVTKLTIVSSSSKQKNGVANNQPSAHYVPSTTGKE